MKLSNFMFFVLCSIFLITACDPNGETVPFWWKDLMAVVQPAALALIGYLAMKGNSKSNDAIKTAELAHDAAAETSRKIDAVKQGVDNAAVRREQIASTPAILPVGVPTPVVVNVDAATQSSDDKMEGESNG